MRCNWKLLDKPRRLPHPPYNSPGRRGDPSLRKATTLASGNTLGPLSSIKILGRAAAEPIGPQRNAACRCPTGEARATVATRQNRTQPNSDSAEERQPNQTNTLKP